MGKSQVSSYIGRILEENECCLYTGRGTSQKCTYIYLCRDGQALCFTDAQLIDCLSQKDRYLRENAMEEWELMERTCTKTPKQRLYLIEKQIGEGIIMIKEALEKLKKEMGESKNPVVKAFGRELMQAVELEQNKTFAQRILDEGKTLRELVADMKQLARKNKTGSCGIVTMSDVKKWYGVADDKKSKEEKNEGHKVVSLLDEFDL